jgi:hypothetical protein
VSWNLLLYALAQTDGEETTYLALIDDMRASLTSAACNVVVQLATKTGRTRYTLAPGGKQVTQALPAAPIHGADVTAFLDDVTGTQAADRTALVFLAHGSGLDKVVEHFGFAPDNYRLGPDPNDPTSFLGNVEIRDAIAASKLQRVDLLGFNACLMATIEIAHELREVAAVQVASQVLAEPWPYGEIVAAMSAAPKQSAAELGITIVKRVQHGITAGVRDDEVAALRGGTAMSALVTAFDAFAERATELVANDWAAVDQAINSAQRTDDPNEVDLASLVAAFGSNDAIAKQRGALVAARLGEVRLASACAKSHPGATGLSVFWPPDDSIDVDAAYQGLDFHDNAWLGFLLAFQAALRAAPPS